MRKRGFCDCGEPLEPHQMLYCSSKCNTVAYAKKKKNAKQEKQIDDFLRESNAIEGVYDEDSFSQAKIAWEYLISQDVLTIDVILKTHKILMLNQRTLTPDQKGYFRTIPVWVGGREGVHHSMIPAQILMKFCFETMRVSPPPDWKALHVVYEHIHPFVDGNGRTGRMFMNWTRIKRCGLPGLIIRADDRGCYYQWFK